MADNFLEKRQEQYRNDVAKGVRKQSVSLAHIMKKSRSCRGYDSSYKVREDQLRRIIAVNTIIPSSRNAQVLRFRMVLSDEALKVLPHIRMGTALPECKLPLPGTEPNAFIIVCTDVELTHSVYIDLGISVQSMMLQAAEIGLNTLCIGSFSVDVITKELNLPIKPLLVLAVGKGIEKYSLVEISADENHNYYRKEGVHYIPKVCLDDLIL